MTDISGTVLTDDGFVIKDANVSLSQCQQVVHTDEMGKFVLVDVPVGTMFLIIEHPDFDQYIMPLMAMDEQPNLVISMNRIATIQTGK
jgi:hypothetical protein